MPYSTAEHYLFLLLASCTVADVGSGAPRTGLIPSFLTLPADSISILLVYGLNRLLRKRVAFKEILAPPIVEEDEKQQEIVF